MALIIGIAINMTTMVSNSGIHLALSPQTLKQSVKGSCVIVCGVSWKPYYNPICDKEDSSS